MRQHFHCKGNATVEQVAQIVQKTSVLGGFYDSDQVVLDLT